MFEFQICRISVDNYDLQINTQRIAVKNFTYTNNKNGTVSLMWFNEVSSDVYSEIVR